MMCKSVCMSHAQLPGDHYLVRSQNIPNQYQGVRNVSFLDNYENALNE